jgi:Tfp pilus assembly protein PilF
MKELSARLPDNPAVQTNMGVLAAAKGNVVAARQSFERALELNPNAFDALVAVVALDIRAGKAQAAVERVDRYLQKQPNKADVFVLSAQAYGAAGDSKTAEARLRKAVSIDPDHLESYAMLGSLYASQKRLDEAKKEFQTVADRQPNNVTAHTIVAMILDAQGKRDEARARYEQILDIDPDASVAANNLAWLYSETDQNLDVALQLAQSASRRLPEHAAVNDTLGWIYYKKGLASLAVPPLEKSVQKDPNNPLFQLHLGLAYAKAGQTVKARTTLRQVLTKNPSIDGADEAKRVLENLGE